MENTNYNEVDQSMERKLPKASKIALIGMMIVLLGSIVSQVISKMYQDSFDELVRKSTAGAGVGVNATAGYIGVAIGFIILAAFVFLAIRLKKAKTKAIAINLIVFSAIFIALGVLGTVVALSATSLLETGYKELKASEATIANLTNLYQMMNLVGFISIAGWSVVLFGGIIGARATEAELEENRFTE